MSKSRGTSNPSRSLALLWRTREPVPRDGRSSLGVGRITRAAIGIADSEGLDALTMRRVSEVLGVGTMTPYTYVPGKAELLDLMVDEVYGELPAIDPVAGDWRYRLERVALDNWALYQAHPWLAQVETSRPVLGPNMLAKYERELLALGGTGLGDVELDSVLTLVLGHVRSTARASAELADLEVSSGVTDAQWWQAQAPFLSKFAGPAQFPNATRVGSAAGEAHNAAFAPDHALHFGLRRLLDGVAVLIAERHNELTGSGVADTVATADASLD